MRIAYVILHYMAGKDTIECANSILQVADNSSHEIKIIIVDNGSTNDSVKEIENFFKNQNRIIVIKNNKNLGFAKGNNRGFCYAKKIFNADFIVQLNNDTIIKQKDFNEKLVDIYYQQKYAVLGPDIITLDGCHQNPGKNVNWTTSKLIKFRTKKRIQLLLTYIPFMDRFLRVNESAFPKKKTNEMISDVCLHGACYIFSSDYISRFDGMYDKTFLYMEEDILKLRADNLGYKMLYCPDIEIIHKEDIATNMVSVSSIEKKRRIYKNLIKSSGVYMKLKKEYDKRCGD